MWLVRNTERNWMDGGEEGGWRTAGDFLLVGALGGWVLRSGDGKQTGGGSRSSEIMWAPKTREDQLQCKKCTKVGAVGERVGTEKLSG